MLEQTILSALIFDESYIRKVLPHIELSYFGDKNQKILFKMIYDFFTKYNSLPSKDVLKTELAQRDGMSESDFDECEKLVDSLNGLEGVNQQWLVDQTEGWCQEKAIYNAVSAAIQIIHGEDKKTPKTAIPGLLSDALAVSFDSKIGHDYFDDAEDRWEFYHTTENRLPLGLDFIDIITKGGVPRKTLNGIMAGINVGKTLIMCDFAARYLRNNFNVLYITLEIAEEKITERVEQNLMGLTNDELQALPKDDFLKRVEEVKSKTNGRFKVKEYPASGVSANNFRFLVQELKVKENFVPDIIFIDYINLCSSARFKAGSVANTNTYMKAVAEEIRGLMQELNCVGWTATQLTRGGMSASDVDMDDTGEAISLPQTLDFMFAAMSNEELEKKSQYLAKQLKNRYRDKKYNRRFLLGVNVDKQTLYHIDDQGVYGDNAPSGTDTTPKPEVAVVNKPPGKRFTKDQFDVFK